MSTEYKKVLRISHSKDADVLNEHVSRCLSPAGVGREATKRDVRESKCEMI